MILLKNFKLSGLMIGAFFFAILLVASWNRPPHVDEYSFLINANYFLSHKTLVPYYTNYPVLFSYILAVPITVAFLIQYLLQGFTLSGLSDPYLVGLYFDLNYLNWLWIGRIITMIFSAATAACLYHFVLKSENRTTALLATGLLCLDPLDLYIKFSVQSLPDIPVTFLALITIILCRNAIIQHRIKMFYWASFLTGLACGLKLNAVILIFSVSLTPLLTSEEKQARLANYFKMGALILAGFASGAIPLLLTHRGLTHGISLETIVLLDPAYVGASRASWWWMLERLWQKNFLMTILMGAGIIYSFLKRTPADKLFHALLIPAIILIGGLERKALHYFLPLYPLFVINIARMMYSLWAVLTNKAIRRMVYSSLGLIFLVFIGQAVARFNESQKLDNNTQAQAWVQKNIYPGSTIFMDWGYVPTLELNVISSYIHSPRLHTPDTRNNELYKKILVEFTGAKHLYQIVPLLNINYRIQDYPPTSRQYLITSSGCYGSIHDLKKANPDTESSTSRQRREFYLKLFRKELGFHLIKSFYKGSGHEVNIFQKIE